MPHVIVKLYPGRTEEQTGTRKKHSDVIRPSALKIMVPKGRVELPRRGPHCALNANPLVFATF